jgi:hypothetical protein
MLYGTTGVWNLLFIRLSQPITIEETTLFDVDPHKFERFGFL